MNIIIPISTSTNASELRLSLDFERQAIQISGKINYTLLGGQVVTDILPAYFSINSQDANAAKADAITALFNSLEGITRNYLSGMAQADKSTQISGTALTPDDIQWRDHWPNTFADTGTSLSELKARFSLQLNPGIIETTGLSTYNGNTVAFPVYCNVRLEELNAKLPNITDAINKLNHQHKATTAQAFINAIQAPFETYMATIYSIENP